MRKIIDIHAAYALALSLMMMLFIVAPTQASEKVSPDLLRGRYFVVVWSYQGPDDDLVHAHTFTSFYSGDDLARGVVKPSTISWLPATGSVQVLGSERGRNFSLDETLRMACEARRKVQSWGPFEVTTELYQRAQQRIALLMSGTVRYSMLNQDGINCIKAAGDITPEPFDTGILWGEAASAAVVRHLSPYFVAGPVKASLPGTLVRSCSATYAGGVSGLSMVGANTHD
ncbi:hypothetical protein [Hyphomicrobium sp.]|uniref:hypothetical protein n=1 Tax=Hyphomicrobium sp. TaxID=82 RepID=UPI000FA5B52F|nr:hypothetical protein [Hyphomicrobium sp.]RUP00543.1 MAG: hypothetical protein EKK30_00300 [Hyphomicrobium sp.]